MASAIGLYIGLDFVDLVALGMAGSRPRVIKSIREVYSEESPAGDHKDHISLVASTIKRAIEKSGLSVKSVNSCPSQDAVMVRRLRMAYLPDEERPNALKYEAQKYLPFKIDEIISDFFITSESKENKAMDALFVAVNKQGMETYARLFRDLKLKFNIVDIMPLALSRLLYACKKIKKGEAKALVYVEKNMRASIIIISDENPYLVREVSLSASKDSLFESILNNIRLSIDYFRRETKTQGVDRIMICGDGQLEELEAYLKENIAATQIELFNIKDEIDGINDLSKKQLIAIGLAMASFEKPGPKINLLTKSPQLLMEKGIIEYKPLIIEGVAVIILLAMLQFFMSLMVAQSKKSVLKVMAKRPALKEVGQDMNLEALQDMEKRFNLRLMFMRNLVGDNRLLLTEKLNNLGRLMPRGVWTESFQFNDELDKSRGMRIEGKIYSPEGDEAALANKMLSDMKASPEFSFGFEDIKLSSLKREALYSRETLAFLIECVGQPIKSPE